MYFQQSFSSLEFFYLTSNIVSRRDLHILEVGLVLQFEKFQRWLKLMTLPLKSGS